MLSFSFFSSFREIYALHKIKSSVYLFIRFIQVKRGLQSSVPSQARIKVIIFILSNLQLNKIGKRNYKINASFKRTSLQLKLNNNSVESTSETVLREACVSISETT